MFSGFSNGLSTYRNLDYLCKILPIWEHALFQTFANYQC